MTDGAIVVEGLTKHYRGRAVVDRLGFCISSGEVMALLGPNGAGKTTTVEIIEGYRRPDGGSVRVLGTEPSVGGSALKARVGLMLQGGGGVYPQARPREVLRLFRGFHQNGLEYSHALFKFPFVTLLPPVVAKNMDFVVPVMESDNNDRRVKSIFPV